MGWSTRPCNTEGSAEKILTRLILAHQIDYGRLSPSGKHGFKLFVYFGCRSLDEAFDRVARREQASLALGKRCKDQ